MTRLPRDLEGIVKSARITTSTLNTDLKAAQSNFLLKGFFKKKVNKDSINRVKEAKREAKKAAKGAAKAAKEAKKAVAAAKDTTKK